MATGYGLSNLWRWAGGSRPSRRDVPEVRWRVGEKPIRIHGRAHHPLSIVFVRKDANPATESVCFPDFGILALLTARGRTAVEIGPRPPGRYEFYSPDGEVTGCLIIES